MSRVKRIGAGRNTTTEVVGKLYGRGLTISRDRLYTMTELIFANTDVQPRHGVRRHYTDEQIDLLEAAFWLKEAGRADDEIAALFRSPETAAEVQRLVADHLRWLENLEALARPRLHDRLIDREPIETRSYPAGLSPHTNA
jgi:DNA-binding transcriptional MerR regulator